MKRWSLKLASYASLNILGRVVQMLAAFIVVRSLAKTDYAWYSLAQNLVGALGMFTVTGIATYDSIDLGERFQVKRIGVKPGASLRLQMHHHRAEHWIVVKGTAEVTRGHDTFLLSENQSTYIPVGKLHRLDNPGRMELEMIEVQSGSYLGEDDIVRFEDSYGRATAPRAAPPETPLRAVLSR